MTEPLPPSYGAYPTAPPTAHGEMLPSRTGDVVVAWVLWSLLLVVCGAVWLLMLLVGFGTGLACAGDSSPDRVCTGRPADVAQAGYFTMWAVMAVAVVASLVMTIVSVNRRRLAWVWPAGGFGLVAASFLIWKLVYDSVA